MKGPSIFLFSLISLIVGIILGLVFKLPQLFFLGFFIFGIILVFKKEKAVLLFLLIFSLGVARSNQAVLSIVNNQLQTLNDSSQKIVLIGNIAKEPEAKELKQKIILSIKKVSESNQKGKVLIYTKDIGGYIKGEKIRVTGELETPPQFEDFDYKKYLNQQGIVSVMYYPKIERLRGAPIFYQFLFKTKEKFRQIANENLSYNHSNLLRAMVLGDKKDLTDKLKESFNKSGIRHITAISGMHISILISILMAFLLGLGLLRKRAALIIILFISLYVVLIGFQPSAIRASLMGFSLILAQVLGRLPDAIRFLLFIAAVMLLINPLIFYDIGFQLSFLAVAGINYLSPFFNKKLKKVPKYLGTRQILSMTFAAQIFTLPILLYHFGYFSLLSPVSNLLIVPLIPLIIGFGFLGILIGVIFSSLSLIMFIPLSFLLSYIISVSSFIAKFSFLALNNNVSLILVLIYYLCLFFVIRRIVVKKRFAFLDY